MTKHTQKGEFEFLVKDGRQGIKCSNCGSESFNANDVKYLYCRACDKHYKPSKYYKKTNADMIIVYTIYLKERIYSCKKILITENEKVPDLSFELASFDIDDIRSVMNDLDLKRMEPETVDIPEIIENWL